MALVHVTELVQWGGSFSDSPQWYATVWVRSSSFSCGDEAEVRSGAELIHTRTPASRRRKARLANPPWGRNFSASFLFVWLCPWAEASTSNSGRMNSIKQVPTRVRSRRVEANLGAEREHFEKQQVNAEKRGWSAPLMWGFFPLLLMRKRWLFLRLRHRMRVRQDTARAYHNHQTRTFVSGWKILALKHVLEWGCPQVLS